MAINGTAGNDVLDGTAGDDLFKLHQGGDDTVFGDAGDDDFRFEGAFTAADSVDGGADKDTVILMGDYSTGLVFGANTIVNVETLRVSEGNNYSLTLNDANVAVGKAMTIAAGTLLATDWLMFDGSAETNGSFKITAGAGNDILTGGAKADKFYLTNGGNDTAHGGGGKDAFFLGGSLTTADTIDGGGGADKMTLDGDYTGGNAVVFGASTMTKVETLNLAAGFGYTVTTHDATVAAGKILTVDALALGGASTLTFNGGAETNGAFIILGGAGVNTLTGGAGSDTMAGGGLADTFNLSSGGNDTGNGNGGNDTFNMGAALTAADAIDGGVGTADHVVLDGDYSGGLTFGATTMINVEHLDLIAGHSYTLTIDNATPVAGQTFNVNGGSMGAGDALVFDATADNDSFINITSGDGNDTLKGNAWSTTFVLHGGDDTLYGGAGTNIYRFFNDGALTAADTIYGGFVSDSIYVQGDYSGGLTLGAAMFTSVEYIYFVPGGAYNFTSDDGNVAAAATLIVDGFTAGSGVGFSWNGAAETDGVFSFIGGTANDIITGGAQIDTFDLTHGGNDTANGGAANDIFNFAAAFGADDAIDGGAGTGDVLNLSGNYAAGVSFGASTLANVESIVLASGNSYKLTTHDATVAAGQTLAITANGALVLDGSAETDGAFSFTCTTAGHTLTGGAKADSFILWTSGGNDTIKGGGGADFINRSSFVGTKTYVFDAVSDSTSSAYDTIVTVNLNVERFDVSGIAAVTGVDAQVLTGTLSTATFDSDLAAAIGAAELAAHHAVVFRPNGGDHANRFMVVVDMNGNVGYQAGEDIVLRLQAVAGTLDASNFI